MPGAGARGGTGLVAGDGGAGDGLGEGEGEEAGDDGADDEDMLCVRHQLTSLLTVVKEWQV